MSADASTPSCLLFASCLLRYPCCRTAAASASRLCLDLFFAIWLSQLATPHLSRRCHLLSSSCLYLTTCRLRLEMHRLRISTRRRLTTGCVVAVAYAQTSLLLMCRCLRHYCDSDCHPRRLSSSSLIVELVLLSSSLSSLTLTSVAIIVVVSRRAVAIFVDFVTRRAITIDNDVSRVFIIIANGDGNRISVPLKVKRVHTSNHKPINGHTHCAYSISALVRGPKNGRTRTGRAWFRK